ncbi:MAG: ADP-ribose pyrophosphatase [Acidobacteria bacterium]|nr:MAG: ADP-ribose pyrophosphatase [Acidobacteriota bacterium]
MEPKWLEWAKALLALSQNGLAYSQNHFDIDRYEAIREIASEIMASYAGVEKNVVLKIFEREAGYATPKVDVRGVVFQDNRILLVKEVADGGWTLPGGWADVNESPKESVVREIREESGYETKPTKLLAIYDRNKHSHVPAFPFHVYKLFILCDLIGGTSSTSVETSDVGFFGENELPNLSLSRVTPAQIRRLFEHHRSPDLPADFD